MKRVFIFSAILSLIFSFTSCSNDSSEVPVSAPSSVTNTETGFEASTNIEQTKIGENIAETTTTFETTTLPDLPEDEMPTKTGSYKTTGSEQESKSAISDENDLVKPDENVLIKNDDEMFTVTQTEISEETGRYVLFHISYTNKYDVDMKILGKTKSKVSINGEYNRNLSKNLDCTITAYAHASGNANIFLYDTPLNNGDEVTISGYFLDPKNNHNLPYQYEINLVYNK